MATPEQIQLSNIAFLIQAFAASPTLNTLDLAREYMGDDKRLVEVIEILEDLRQRQALWPTATPLYSAASDRLTDFEPGTLERSVISALLFALRVK